MNQPGVEAARTTLNVFDASKRGRRNKSARVADLQSLDQFMFPLLNFEMNGFIMNVSTIWVVKIDTNLPFIERIKFLSERTDVSEPFLTVVVHHSRIRIVSRKQNNLVLLD